MPEETYHSIETQAGVLCGRCAIWLTEVRYNGHELLLEGAIEDSSATKPLSSTMRYAIVFNGVLAFRSVELDSWLQLYYADTPDQSSFIEVVNSVWQARLSGGGKVTSSYRHFVFLTYDDVFDIVCEDFDMRIEAVSP